MHPNVIIINSNNELNKSRSLSYYSVNNGNKRDEYRKSTKKETIREYKLDAAELIVDRIRNQIKKYFRKLKVC